MDSGVAQNPISDWEKYHSFLLEKLGNDNKTVKLLFNRAKSNPKKIVFAEADHLNVLKAAQIVYEEGIGTPILLGNKKVILKLMQEIEFDEDAVEIIDPKQDELEELRNEFAQKLWEKRKRKGITLLDAQKWMRERNYFACMMVNLGHADGLVTGFSRSYPSTLKPILQLIDKIPNISTIATTNVLMTSKGPIFLSDTAININPTAEELSKIALMTSKIVKLFGFESVMAMVNFSNFGTSTGESAVKIQKAVKFLHENHPNLIVDGDIQIDFALNSELLKEKFPFSKLANKNVNTFVFPNLESANICYKMIKELNKVDSIGPIIMGLSKPVHIFQHGASVEEMVNMAAITVINAQELEKVK
jgi:malate dehydrogenase (oxaloacetate-decarboxylating)(NADP+)